MRNYDFAPLWRSTIGFDRLFDLAETAQRATEDNYPPYNIERTAENEYRISMAVAGFGADELKLEAKESLLTVTGQKAEETDKERDYLHRGIAARNFERRFQLADYVVVKGADLKDGMLHIDLVRELPERMKPRRIAIGGGDRKERVIEHAAQ